MTTASDALQPLQPEPAGGAKVTPLEPAPAAESTLWPRIEAGLEAISDRLNPILVKEARQAMKSMQFLVTFTLLLILGWMYTVLFVLINLPGVFYSPFGSNMLYGYYLILAVPLLLVVPYASFRSLAAELEDGTFDLLSITSLTARQIVTGKLGSSVLQMLVYYSALAPCIAFTYLLRGIDVVTIALLLTYTFLASLLLSILALLLSTVTRARHWQVLLSVLLVMALLLFTFFWCMGMMMLLAGAPMMPYDQSWYWMLNLAWLSFAVALGMLFVQIAAGQITFASENRSTSVRAMLLVVQLLIIGWTVYGFMLNGEEEVLMAGAAGLGFWWAVAGAFLIGEMGQLSPRARRELPQSLLGRMAFTWFNPGSGTGYVFALLSALGGMVTLAFLGLGASLMMGSGGLNRLDVWTAWWLAIMSYLAIYLGLARLFGVFLRWINVGGGMLSVFVFYILLVLLGLLTPLALQALAQTMLGYGWQWDDYTPLQLPNFFWTLIEIGDNNYGVGDGLVWVLAGTGGFIFFLNFILAAGEVEQTRVAAPQRVQLDDRELHPEPVQVKRGPWDEPPAVKA